MKVNNFNDFKGKRIIEIRPMNKEEMRQYYWDQPAIVVFLEGNEFFIASRDEEGNGPGALFTASGILC